MELEAKTAIGRFFNLIAAYAYTDARVTGDTDPANVGKRRGAVPLHTLSAWGEYDLRALGMPGFKIALGVRHIDSTLGLSVPGTVPAYTLGDSMLSYTDGSWRYALNVTNLADKEYIASCTYGCFYGERRKIIASASYRW